MCWLSLYLMYHVKVISLSCFVISLFHLLKVTDVIVKEITKRQGAITSTMQCLTYVTLRVYHCSASMKNWRYPSLKPVGNMIKKFIRYTRAQQVSLFPIQNNNIMLWPFVSYTVSYTISLRKHKENLIVFSITIHTLSS